MDNTPIHGRLAYLAHVESIAGFDSDFRIVAKTRKGSYAAMVHELDAEVM